MTSQEDDTFVMYNEVLLLKINKFKLIECTNAQMGMYIQVHADKLTVHSTVYSAHTYTGSHFFKYV